MLLGHGKCIYLFKENQNHCNTKLFCPGMADSILFVLVLFYSYITLFYCFFFIYPEVVYFIGNVKLFFKTLRSTAVRDPHPLILALSNF